MDEKALLKIQIQSYEFYAALIDRAVGGGHLPKLPRWDEQRAAEYRELAAQLRRRLEELEAQERAAEQAAQPEDTAAGQEAPVLPSDARTSTRG